MTLHNSVYKAILKEKNVMLCVLLQMASSSNPVRRYLVMLKLVVDLFHYAFVVSNMLRLQQKSFSMT